ncbi:MAG TPA: hypothetical protein V6C64_12685 [Microcoleaceae cyanobacterium]|jgi:hypothetical protein
MHKCAAKDCPINVPPHLLMCLRHWTMVPQNIQTQVYQGWRRQQRSPKRVEQYWQARQSAIGAVRQQEIQEQHSRIKGYTDGVEL